MWPERYKKSAVSCQWEPGYDPLFLQVRPSSKRWCLMRAAESLKLVSMVLIGAIAACGVKPSDTSTSSHLLPAPTSAWRPGEPALEALAAGTLEGGYKGNRYCVWLSVKSGQVPIVWPAGYHIRLHPLELLNSHARVVAEGGDRISVGGGFSPDKPASECMLGQKEAFVVMSGITLISATH